jgi:hypothetical protein
VPEKKSHAGLWIADALVLVILGGVISAVLWNHRLILPALSGLLATPTPTNTPTLPPTFTPTITLTRTPRPTATATPVPAWVTDFAQPILDAVAYRPPDFQDNFSQTSTGWQFRGGEIEISNGVLAITVEPDQTGSATNPGMRFNNFALLVEANLNGLEGEDTAEITWLGTNNSRLLLELKYDGRWFVSYWENNSRKSLSSGRRPIISTEKVTLKLISNDAHYVLYIDETPVSYITFNVPNPGKIINLQGWAGGSTTATVIYDNLKVWDLDKIQNLP